MTLPELRSLYDRVCKADGPDRAIDIDLMVAFLPRHRIIKVAGVDDLIRFSQVWDSSSACWRDADRIAYTASLDAITALIERELPGVARESGNCVGLNGKWFFGRITGAAFCMQETRPTEPLALTAAFLAACIAKREAENAE